MSLDMPLLGFRWWQVERLPNGEVALLSWVRDRPWKRGWNTSIHDYELTDGHWQDEDSTTPTRFTLSEQMSVPVEPSRRCQCGYYGWYRLDSGIPWFKTSSKGAAVMGAFIAAGTIQHHKQERGFRAEMAKVVALARVNTGPSVPYLLQAGMALAEEMNFPIINADKHFEQRCREWGELWPEAV